MASGEEAEFIPYVYNIRDNSAAHFNRRDEKI
jgi:hypothetical protein